MSSNLNVKTVDIDSLGFDPANARRHDRKNLEIIKGSLLRFGQQSPLIVCKDNLVRKGNGTLEAAKSLGWKKIDVIVTNLTGAELAAYGIADNRSSDSSDWDDPALAKILSEIQIEDEELVEACGFSEDEIKKLIDESTGMEDDKGSSSSGSGKVELIASPVSVEGDEWILGAHRIIIADPTPKKMSGALSSKKKISVLVAYVEEDDEVKDDPFGYGVVPNVSVHAIDSSPAHADTCIIKWINKTKCDAIHKETKKTWIELANERGIDVSSVGLSQN